MATTGQGPKLVVIVGPTASGKSKLALRVAQEFNGEIIAADSRTVYKNMDIGTAKPSKKDQAKVKHWGLDLVEPGQRFTAAKFKTYAQTAIKDIRSRGKLPILVGGTGLYIDGVIFAFGFRPDTDPARRQRLEILSVGALQGIIHQMNLPLPANFKNKRHLIRTIETKGQAGSSRKSLSKGVILVGIRPPDEILKKRIDQRAEQFFANNVLAETKQLLDHYGPEALETSGGIVYKICLEMLAGKISQNEAIEKFKRADWQYARRQKTWFKRNKFIHWFGTLEQAYSYIKSQLNT